MLAAITGLLNGWNTSVCRVSVTSYGQDTRTTIGAESAVTIFRIKRRKKNHLRELNGPEMKTVRSFETSGTTRPTTTVSHRRTGSLLDRPHYQGRSGAGMI